MRTANTLGGLAACEIWIGVAQGKRSRVPVDRISSRHESYIRYRYQIGGVGIVDEEPVAVAVDLVCEYLPVTLVRNDGIGHDRPFYLIGEQRTFVSGSR